MNYIRDISYKVKKSAISDMAPDNLYNAVVEISNGDNVKYEVHPTGEYLTAVRALNSIFKYPFSYGYIPQTKSEDGDGLDVIIVTPEPLAHLSVIEVKVLGYVPMEDKGKNDPKIVAVPAYSNPEGWEIEQAVDFLKNYKYPDNEVDSVGDFISDDVIAKSIIESAHMVYEEEEFSDEVDSEDEADIYGLDFSALNLRISAAVDNAVHSYTRLEKETAVDAKESTTDILVSETSDTVEEDSDKNKPGQFWLV